MSDGYVKDEKVWIELERRHAYHSPKGDQQERYELIRDAVKTLAKLYVGYAPESRELSLALTNLEQSQFWANAAIARNE